MMNVQLVMLELGKRLGMSRVVSFGFFFSGLKSSSSSSPRRLHFGIEGLPKSTKATVVCAQWIHIKPIICLKKYLKQHTSA